MANTEFELKKEMRSRNMDLIRKLAWTYSHKTGLDFDELYAEGCLAYLEALQTYDPLKGKLSTHAWHIVSGTLLNYIKNEYKHTALKADDVETCVEYKENFFERFSKEAAEVVEIIIDSPWDVIGKDRKEAQKQVMDTLKNKGWETKKIISAFNSLKLAYN
jgi:DNA-directed RNA polymerase specialized sigma24 family protein